jgi:tetratricopeptide (TPR) repeat protein
MKTTTYGGLQLVLALTLAFSLGGCKERSETPSHPSPSQMKTELELARATLESGDVRGAVSRAFAITEAHPDFHTARVLLASAYVLDGKEIQGLIEANKVVLADPSLVGGWVAKCAALHAQSRTEEGIEACEKALELEPSHGAALMNLAALFGVGKKLEKQGEMLDRLAVVRPDDAGVRIAMASNRATRGKMSEAIKEAKAGLERDPKNVNLLFFIAQASWEEDQVDQAMEYAELAGKFDPDRTEAVQLFEQAFTVIVAARLTCAHGPAPWTREQKKVALADTPIRGVQGVISFQNFLRDYREGRGFKRRLKRAVESCQAAAQKAEKTPEAAPVGDQPLPKDPPAAEAAPERPPGAPAQAP